ncbi:MAG: hypothetical protein ACYC2W_03580 [Desulfurivibrionaceae bacterium]
MDNEQNTSVSIAKNYAGCEDIYDELVGDSSNSWLFGLVAFAVVEEQKIEWIKHQTKSNGRPPTSDDIQTWYKQLPPGAVLRAKGTAENALALFSTEVIDENEQETRKQIEESVIVSEIREIKRFWPQFGVNLAGGFISSLLFALLLVAIAVIVLKDPSPVGLVEKMQQNSEVKTHGTK